MLDKTDLMYKVRRVQTMINERDQSDLDDMLAWMENAFRSNYQLPDELVAEDVEWIHRVTSTDPHDAVRTGARALSTVMPRVTLHPLMNNPESRAVTNEIERALQWQFKQASERREVKILHDVVLSALLYDEVIISVWYLPEQIKIMKKWGVDPARLKHAKRYGDYIIKVHNPRDTIVEYSDLFSERVVFRSILPVQEVIDYWGERANELATLSEEESHKEYQYVTLYDYSEVGGHRAVFAYLQPDENSVTDFIGGKPIEILNEKTPYDFLPISAKIGGTSLASEGAHQRIPLLWSIYNSGQWETQNIVETLQVSEALAYSVSPRYAVENEYDNDDVDMDFREPARIVNLKRGQALRDLRPPAMNDNLTILSERIAGRMDKSTLPRFLQSGEVAGSFSSMNLASQAGMKALAPYKALAESALAEMFTIMLYWVHHSKEPLISYVPKNTIVPRDEDGNPKLDVTAQKITIGGDDSFDPEHLYLQVKLTEDAPSDFLQKINAGSMMVERLGYPYSKALEFVGENDPESAIALRTQEERIMAEREAKSQEILNESSLEVMQMREQLAQGIEQIQQLMAQLQQAMAQVQQGGAQGGPEGGPPIGAPSPLGPGPDGSVPPDQQALFSAGRSVPGGPGTGPPPGQPGGPPVPSPQLNTNPAQGDIPPIQGAPGMGLREESQELAGE